MKSLQKFIKASLAECSRRSLQKECSLYADEATTMVHQKEKNSIEKQIQQVQRSLNLVTKADESKVRKQWKEISKEMRKAVKEHSKK
ncbi:hypothetical protein HOY82DRAFT_596084 [Tuber indicum]|nr:hypothetical protein HOY82DRAFT_596084 [Tuber indicum]